MRRRPLRLAGLPVITAVAALAATAVPFSGHGRAQDAPPVLAAEMCERAIAITASPAPDAPELFGSFAFPCVANADAALPVVLMLAGSGPTDRDGNQPGFRTDMQRALAEDLAARGIASLRVDKRGVGASAAAAPDEAAMTLDMLAGDAARWTRAARTLAAGAAVVTMGHSEGGLLALLAARRVVPDGLILAATAGEPAGRMLARQIDQAPMDDAMRSRARRILAELIAGRRVDGVPLDLAPLFRASVQPYLISWLGIDPAAIIESLRGPVLILQGDRDLQVTVADARRLAGARPQGTRVQILGGLNHVFKPAPVDRAANIAAYTAPGMRPDPRVAGLIADFVSAVVPHAADVAPPAAGPHHPADRPGG